MQMVAIAIAEYFGALSLPLFGLLYMWNSPDSLRSKSLGQVQVRARLLGFRFRRSWDKTKRLPWTFYPSGWSLPQLCTLDAVHYAIHPRSYVFRARWDSLFCGTQATFDPKVSRDLSSLGPTEFCVNHSEFHAEFFAFRIPLTF